MEFANLLKRHRVSAGLSQWDLADKTAKFGIKRSLISLMEMGERTPPLESLTHLSDALGLTGDDRRVFEEAAYLDHAPAEVRAMVSRMRSQALQSSQQVAEMQRQLALILAILRKKGIKLPKVLDDR